MIKHRHLKFSVAVRLFFAHILRHVYSWLVTMVMRYEVISSRWSSHFWVKMHVFFFPFLSTIKVKLVGETTRSNYFFFILHVYNINSHCFYSPPRAAPPPIKYTSSWREDQMLSTEGKKSFRNSATYQKPKREGGGGGLINPLPHLVPRWGYDFVCTSEG